MNWPIVKSVCSGTAALLAASLLAGPALADGMPTRGHIATPPPEPPQRLCALSANVALASEYVFRGVSQTSEGPAIQGGFDATCGRFYAGVWASNLDWGPATRLGPAGEFLDATWASMELDSYGGIKGKIGRFSYDLGAIYYAYPNSTRNVFFFDDGFDRFRNDYVELKAGTGVDLWKDGTLGVTGYYSPDYQYETGDVWTLEVGFAQAFPAYWGFTPTFSALYGHQWGNDTDYARRVGNGDDNYGYWNAGVTLGFLEKWSVDLRYWDTDLGNGCGSFDYFQCDSRFVGTLKFTY
jgi:uncharacterized protein (TIGR02001 family)